MTHPDIDAWSRLEKKYSARSYSGEPERSDGFFVNRDSRVLITAPHSVQHFLDGSPKPPDLGTGGLAELLGQKCGLSVLTAARTSAPWDVWGARGDDFTRVLRSQLPKVELVIDLHGMSDLHGIDICLGLGPAPDERTAAASALIRRAFKGYEASENAPFDAAEDSTVTSFVQNVGPAAALQVEIAQGHRGFEDSPQAATRFAARLASALESIERAFAV